MSDLQNSIYNKTYTNRTSPTNKKEKKKNNIPDHRLYIIVLQIKITNKIIQFLKLYKLI